jgi:hypothetical protein
MASARRGIVCHSLSLVFFACVFDSGGVLAKGDKKKKKKRKTGRHIKLFSRFALLKFKV